MGESDDPFRVAEGMDQFPWAEATRLFTLGPPGEVLLWRGGLTNLKAFPARK